VIALGRAMQQVQPFFGALQPNYRVNQEEEILSIKARTFTLQLGQFGLQSLNFLIGYCWLSWGSCNRSARSFWSSSYFGGGGGGGGWSLARSGLVFRWTSCILRLIWDSRLLLSIWVLVISPAAVSNGGHKEGKRLITNFLLCNANIVGSRGWGNCEIRA